MKILIMGLPGSGKTTLAQDLVSKLEETGKTVTWLNADKIREIFNDWDFSYDGRIRQAVRMKRLANGSEDDYVIADFVAPLKEMRDIFAADYTIWMNTINEGRFEDTNIIFEKPDTADLIVTEKDVDLALSAIFKTINIQNKFVNDGNKGILK